MATIYICGVDSIRENKDGCVDKKKIITRLKSLKCSVTYPSEITFSDMNWSETLDNRLQLLKRSQAVYVLPNWRDDIMTRIELNVAMDLKLETIFHPASNKEIKQIITSLDN